MAAGIWKLVFAEDPSMLARLSVLNLTDETDNLESSVIRPECQIGSIKEKNLKCFE
jgi:hypothetical protein